ncbi:hypothetical protein B0A48_01892 [Cryoendolithus antarcticus]|uniref:PH domain-containing protein n=1 Tax=Cryoendolithus antarcticus TaxID=1507870 RepID=A0A1V8TQK1_9PEZI|nr:hypothetical protein B0A48_01892 [Cryoendolithus antarcticus]
MVRQVQPLRISKTTPGSSPEKKMAATARPLAEISSGSMRRNSPSYNQATRKMIVSRESSPYVENASPNSTKPSPRDFWSPLHTMATGKLDGNDAPDRSPSPGLSPRRRASIEKLQSASRVKNSKIFALESKDVYDPDSLPIVERPVANRPMSQQFIQNSFTRFDSMRKENSPLRKSGHGHKRSETEINVPILSPTKLAIATALPPSPEKQGSPSPTKSALRASQYGLQSQDGTENDISVWDDERSSTPRALHRHHKSVTFHADPPEVNEYEQQTPEPSVAASNGSREASWDSDDVYDQDVSFERGSSAEVGGDDSFDEDLENADKTPVVLPEHWARMSPEEARMDLIDDEDDVFDSPATHSQRPILGRSESVTSDGEARPLPPIPGIPSTARRNSTSLAATAERASLAVHSPPSPLKRASCSKEEILQMTRSSSLTLQDRLELMRPEARRGSVSAAKPMLAEHAEPEEFSITNLDSGERMDLKVRVREAEVEEDSLVGDLQDFANAPPRISRESILRKVRNTKYDFDDEDSEGDVSELVDEQRDVRPSYAELAKMDPDEPIPSRENSRETSETYLQKRKSVDDFVSAIDIKPEPTDDEVFDMASVPAAAAEQVQVLQSPRSPARLDDYERQSSVIHHPMRDESESNASDGSKYSSMEPELEGTVFHQKQSPVPEDGRETLQDAMQLLTVKDYSTPTLAEIKPKQVSGGFMSLPQYLSTNDYSFGMDRYITPSPPPSNESTLKLDNTAVPVLQPSVGLQDVLSLPRAPYAGADLSPPGTPNSVIHHSSDADSYEQYDDAQLDQLQESKAVSPPVPSPVYEEPMVPERKATIKTGGKLKARPSGARADFEAMLDFDTPFEPVPAIPEAYQESSERSLHSSSSDSSKTDSALGAIESAATATESPKKRRQSKRHQLDLDIPAVEGEGWGLDEAFDKVIQDQQVGTPISFPPLNFTRNPQSQVESCVHDPQPAGPTPFSPHNYSAGANVPIRQQKGYLMRQNTKVVIASNRNISGSSTDATASTMEPPRRGSSRGAKGSPRKPSAEQFLKIEPWNGASRRKSVRNASAQNTITEPAPPLPGQESALGVVSENATGTGSLDEEVSEGVEKGRLFVKVVGVKNLDLPMPANDRIYFKLTLDNGLHCVTTAPLELGKTAPIGQEFELVVHNDLEFQLTLNTKLPPKQAPPPVPAPASPTKSTHSQKQSVVSRLLMSPRKRAERERNERAAEEAEHRRVQEETAARKRASVPPSAWDKLHDLVNAADGSFARSYINLASHEERCFGRPLTVDVPCYNEWALEKNAQIVNSVRSKRGTQAGGVRKPPYVIGALELQLLYVPRPKDCTDEEMPKSMSSAIREIGRASEVKPEVSFEGHLSQQGGDCVHWRRRFFTLSGPRLTAYHEHTHQKRAVINLSKASRLVDDRRTLVADPTASPTKSSSPVKASGRRKSAFAEEDEGYQYVEEGFRIRFANGETIDFYADSKAEKEEWMAVLAQVVGRKEDATKRRGWTDLVLAREKLTGKPAAGDAVRKEDARPAVARQTSDRKPVGGGSKSVPSSPVKSAHGVKRPSTPPLAARQGHRTRDAVKSMIF